MSKIGLNILSVIVQVFPGKLVIHTEMWCFFGGSQLFENSQLQKGH